MEFFCACMRMNFKRYHIILAAVFFAIIMWGTVTLGEEFSVSLDVPLILHNIPEGKALRGYLPSTVSVRLRGTGWRIVSMLFSGTPQCVLNVGALGSQPVVVSKTQLMNNIILSAGVHAVDVNIDTLVLSLDRYVERELRVQADVIVDCPDGYGVVGDIRVKPERIVVGGAESILRAADSWKTEHAVFTRVREPFVAQVPVLHADGYVFHIPQKVVQVSVNVQPFAEKTLTGLRIETRFVPPYREIIFIPPRVDVIVRGGIDQLATLSSDDVRLSVDYRDLVDDTTGFVQPAVESPPGIRVLAKRPEQLQYIIRKRL
jgi:hypothetical protein